MGWIQDFLRSRNLPFSGTKDDLRARVLAYLDERAIQPSDLVALLDAVEGWGNQHVYLYKAPDSLIAYLADEKRLKGRLKKLGVDHLLNARMPLLLPDHPTLSAIESNSHGVRFVWIEKRAWRDRLPDQDRQEGDVQFDAYQLKEGRGVVSFSCDLVSGCAALLIGRLPSGTDYKQQKERFEQVLDQILDVDSLTNITVSAAIRRIDESDKVRKRSSTLVTTQGNGAVYTSRSRKEDVYEDPDIRNSRNALGKHTAGRLGNFYWPTAAGDREIHVKLYAKDQRVGIFGECTREEVEYVLAQIRGYCT